MRQLFYIYRLIYVFIIIGSLLQSCIQELEWIEEGDIQELLVVEGLITSEQKAHYVKLSRNRGVIVEGKPEGVSGAIITISDGENTYLLAETEAGLYLTDSTVAGTLGKTYELRIELEGEVFIAIDSMVEATIPEPVSLREAELAKGFYWVTYPGNFGVVAPARLTMQIKTPAGWADTFPEEYRITEFWQERKDGYESNDTTYYLHPSLEPPAILAYGIGEIGIYPLGSIIEISHASLSEGYYNFIRALMSETEWKGLGPFGYNPANLPTNISNGAVGYFGTSHITTFEQVIEE